MRTAIQAENLHKNGFTLVELVIVLSLLSVVLASVFLFFDFTQKVYKTTEAQNIVQDDLNKIINQMGKDIRAGRRPNSKTKAVVLVNIQQMDIYSNNDDKTKVTRISYRLNPTQKSELQRGYVESATASEDANPQYGSIDNWVTILTGVQYLDAANKDIVLYSDITATADEPSDRRVIKINIKARDQAGIIVSPVDIPLVFTSRSKS